MNNFKLEIKLEGPALIGSGVGFGAEIDTDIVFDEFGLPYIPAKRIKGCLREAINEITDMFSMAEIDAVKIDINKTFGKAGEKDLAPVYFSNLYLPDYEKIRAWLNYLTNEYSTFITHDRIIEHFTEIYQQTKIDKYGVADEHTLRTIRVLRKGLRFEGQVKVDSDEEIILNTLLLACQNFRQLGTKRNRGYGKITCVLYDSTNKLDAKPLLEEICTE